MSWDIYCSTNIYWIRGLLVNGKSHQCDDSEQIDCKMKKISFRESWAKKRYLFSYLNKERKISLGFIKRKWPLHGSLVCHSGDTNVAGTFFLKVSVQNHHSIENIHHIPNIPRMPSNHTFTFSSSFIIITQHKHRGRFLNLLQALTNSPTSTDIRTP